MLAPTSLCLYLNTYFGIVKVSLHYIYSCFHFGDQCGDFQRRLSDLKISTLLEIFQMFHIHMHLNRIVVSRRCCNSSCSGRGSPGSGAVVQRRSGNPQEESTLLQGGVMQTTITHVPKHRKVLLSCENSSYNNVPCILIF